MLNIQLKCLVLKLCLCSRNMAYVFGFTRDVTTLIYAMRDWKFENVRRNGGTPSRLALKYFKIINTTAEYPIRSPAHTYYITVDPRNYHPDLYITALNNNKFYAQDECEWADNLKKGNGTFQRKHGVHIYPCSTTVPDDDFPDDQYGDDGEYLLSD